MLAKSDINIEFDGESQDYYVVWEPVALGLGKTEAEALEDLRAALHFYADTLIDLKLQDISPIKED